MNNSKAKIIAVANQKGGVAKTTSVINIGAGLALKGKKVLLVDTDNQSHLSRFLGYDGTDGKPTISELIWRTVSKVQKPVSEAIRKSELGVDYIPSNFMLARIISILGTDSDSTGVFSRLFSDGTFDEYDYIIIDCPPTLDLLVSNALKACDKVLIEAAVELSFISEVKQHIIFEHINGMNIAYNVITRHFKVAMTKKIHTVADSVSDEEFSANIDKIIFSVYETKMTVPTAQVGLEVPLTAKQDNDKAEIPVEQAETITEETTVPGTQVGLEVPLTPKQDKDKTEISAKKAETIKEKTTAPDTQVGLEVPLPAVEEKKKAIVVTEQHDPTAPEAQNELKNILSASKNGQPIKFRDEEHERNYNFILDMMPYSDIERKALAYLFALDTVCFEHIRDLYDFSDNRIMLSGLEKDWQTGTSGRTTRLAFNLYNGYCSDGETYIGSDGTEDSLPSAYYSPVYLFCCEYAKYYVEALKIRFPEFFGK